jgi:hypothetical protein
MPCFSPTQLICLDVNPKVKLLRLGFSQLKHVRPCVATYLGL